MAVPGWRTFWTEQTVQILRDMWMAGSTTSEIARKLRTTKNAVIGRARREGLPGRDSPIIRKSNPGAEMRMNARREGKRADIERMLREGHSVFTVKTAMRVHEEFVRRVRDNAGIAVAKPGGQRKAPMPIIPSPRQNVIPFPAPPPPKPKPPAPVFAAPVGFVPGMVRKCQWPIGEPGTKSFRFCSDSPVVFNRPYCEEHCRMAYVPRRAESEVA